MAHPVTHFEVNARDAKELQRFYGDLFGWSIDSNNPQEYGMIDTGAKGQGINGGIGASQTGDSWITFYIESPDPGATLQKIERLGGRTIMPPMDMGMVTYALFADPEGNRVGLVKSDQQQRRAGASNGGTARRATTTAKKKTTAKKTAAKATTVKRATAKRSTSRTRSTGSRASSRGRGRR